MKSIFHHCNSNLVLLSLLISSLLSSCNNTVKQYEVYFYFPDAKTNGLLPKFIAAYGMDKYGVPIEGESLLSLTDELQKKIFGGVSTHGSITIEDDFITFEPGFGSSLMSDGFKIFQIPISDIINVKSESFLVIGRAVVIDTKNGQFKFQLAKPKHFYNPFEYEDEDICQLLRKKAGLNGIVIETQSEESKSIPKLEDDKSKIEVPDVIGMVADEAEILIFGQNLQAEFKYIGPKVGYADGTIINQNPTGIGNKIEIGGTLKLEVTGYRPK